MPTNIAIRLNVEGGAELKRTMDDAGRSGQQAFQAIGTAADAAGAASDRLTQKVRQAGEAANAARTTGAASRATAPSATAREVERIRTQLDAEYAKQKQLDRAGSVIERGYSSGAFDDAERARLTSLAAQRYGTAAPRNDNMRGLDSRDRMFIQYSAFSGASSLSAGAGLGSVAVQQGTGIVQHLADREGGLKAGLADVAASASKLVNPFTLGAAAVVGLGAAFVTAAMQAGKDHEALERATLGVGRLTGATASQLEGLAQASAAASKSSTGSTREFVAAYASSGQVVLPVIGDLSRATEAYAKLTGQDATSATAELTKAFGDLSNGGLDTIASRIGGLDDKTRQLILTQAEQYDKTTAQKTAADYLLSTVASNTSATGGWAAAWDTAAKAAAGYWDVLKHIAGVKLGVITEAPGVQASALDKQIADMQARLKEPGGYTTMQPSEVRAQIAALEAQRNALRQAEADAAKKTAIDTAKERSDKLSTDAGKLVRGMDPNDALASKLRTDESTLSAALADPNLINGRTTEEYVRLRSALDATTRARESLYDANGKLITSEERTRQSNQLSLDIAKAQAAGDKERVANLTAVQTKLQLVGQVKTPSDVASQAEFSRKLSLASAGGKSGSGSEEKADDYDRASKSLEDRTRRLKEQAETYGLSAEAVERYRAQTELLTGAERSERTITPELTADIARRADAAAEAAKRMEDLKEASKRTDDLRSVGSDGVRTLVRDLADGAKAGKIMEDTLASIKSRVADLASTSVSDLIFGQRRSSGSGLLGGLLSRAFGGSSEAANAPAMGAQGPTYVGGASSLTSTIASLFGFDGGGYTGPGGRFDPAGIVHRGEIVFSQDDVRRFGGVDRVEAIRRSGRGYADGGYVGGGYTLPSAAGGAITSSAPSFNLIDQRPAGSPDIAPTAQRRSDGGYDLIIRGVESAMGQRAAAGRGPFKQALPSVAYRQG